MFQPLNPANPTAMQTKDGDKYFRGKSMLYPSPASGRGDRIFLLTHVCVHILAVVLTIAFLGEVADHAQSNSIEGDYFAAVMSLILYLLGVISVVSVSLMSKYPFENHGIVTALTLWAFVGAFSALVLSFSSLAGSLASDHNARVLGFWVALVQSCGIAFLFSGYINGLAAANRLFIFDSARDAGGRAQVCGARRRQGVSARRAPSRRVGPSSCPDTHTHTALVIPTHAHPQPPFPAVLP